jgi:hypothetical protein
MKSPDDLQITSEAIFRAPPDFYGNFYDYNISRVAAEEAEALRNNPNAGMPVGSYMPAEIERIRAELSKRGVSKGE